MSAFPDPPTPDQEWTHPTTGITYVFDAVNNTWNISYKTATSTGTLPLINPTSFTLPTSLPDVPAGTLVQSQYNEWLFGALQHVNAEANIQIQPAPGPDDPDIGRLWYNTDTEKLYLYYYDGNSTQWVEIVGGGDVDLSDYATITYSDEEDAKLQAQIDDLKPEPDLGPPTTVQRLYRFLTTTSLNQGDMYGNTEVAADLAMVAFASKDSTGQLEPEYSAGDELSIGEWKYKFTDAYGRIEYVSGPGGNITVNNRYAVTFTIYPTNLASRVAAGEEIQAEIQATIDTALTTQADIQSDLTTLQNQVDDLEVVKGAVAKYDCAAVALPYNARVGECMFSDATASAVLVLGFGVENKDGILTKSMQDGDIIEVIAPDGTTSRYAIADASSAPQMVAVTYVSGEQTFAVGTEYSVYIYPQNEEGVSQEYVDAQDALKLDLTGGDLTGTVTTDSLIKSTRTSGYAFQVYDEANDNNPAFIHSNGNIRGAGGTFTDAVEIRKTLTLKEGSWIAGNLGFHAADKGVRYYLDDQATHFADVTRKGVVLQNLMYGDNLWTLKVQDSSNANSKTLIYGDYSSGLILNEVGEINLTGGITTQGSLSFTGTGKISATSSTALSGRACLEIASAADYPVVISSGSGYKKVLSIYGFDGNQDDNRGETAYINADGKAHFNTVYANDEELATKAYVDAAQFRPAQLAWVWDGDKGTETSTPTNKRFHMSESGGNLYLRFSYETNNGVNLGDGKFADTQVSFSDGPIGTIWEYIPANGKWKLKRQFRVSHWRWNFTPPGSSSSHFEFRMSSSHGHDWTNLVTGVQYYITVGGFF